MTKDIALTIKLSCSKNWTRDNSIHHVDFYQLKLKNVNGPTIK